MELLQEARSGSAQVPELVRALGHENVVVRRTAARLLGEMGEPGTAALAATQNNSDALVRRTGLAAICRLGGAEVLDAVERALGDSSAMVRLAAVQYLESARPRTETVLALLDRAGGDPDDRVREIAARATWPFFRESASVRDRQGVDRDVIVAQTFPLPKDGWRFALDPLRSGHKQGWYEPGFDDSGWATISIEQAWQKAGYEYTGVTWYRRSIQIPSEIEHLAVDLHFGGVDESAWVWLNGMYVGQHDIGPSGWNEPFRLDITGEIRWGDDNHIAVRAMNTAHAGGIWRPVAVEVLR
jgi:hypothetical protein